MSSELIRPFLKFCRPTTRLNLYTILVATTGVHLQAGFSRFCGLLLVIQAPC